MNIKQLRKDKNLTQVKLAVLCGVSLTTIRMWEQEAATPNPENLVKLQEALEIEL